MPFFISLCLSTPTSANVQNIEKLRLAFLFQLTKFIIWPNETFESNSSTIKICFLGDHPQKELDEFNKNINKNISQGRNLQTYFYKNWLDLQVLPPSEICQIVYIPHIEAPPQGLIELAHKSGYFLIGDNIKFIDSGGMMALTLNDTKLSIVISQNWIKNSNIKLQSRFLQIVTIR